MEILRDNGTIILSVPEIEDRIKELRNVVEKYNQPEYRAMRSLVCGRADELEEILKNAKDISEARFGGSFKELDEAAEGYAMGYANAVQSMSRKMRDQHDIDWEQRRYEIAKEMMPWCASTVKSILNSGGKIDGASGKTVQQVTAESAVLYADALIEVLKGGNHES